MFIGETGYFSLPPLFYPTKRLFFSYQRYRVNCFWGAVCFFLNLLSKKRFIWALFPAGAYYGLTCRRMIFITTIKSVVYVMRPGDCISLGHLTRHKVKDQNHNSFNVAFVPQKAHNGLYFVWGYLSRVFTMIYLVISLFIFVVIGVVISTIDDIGHKH